ncbi:nucleotide sugar dehydrogenase [Nocardia sp. XZ_19_369]|uniref:nucleotide sugar dehydrogenase n=1 Tax=Nocardia sp. XZ_19_369 TaxID=2769487 RepID=UPI00188FECCD|nr:nucleotide sugar dehydrogenase [Nocardia sp. XZ_19_369]
MELSQTLDRTTEFGFTVVVVGVGYVGLRLCHEAALAGHHVIGLDIDTARIEAINRGVPPTDTITPADLTNLHERGFRATDDPAELDKAQVIVLCVPTPLRKGLPDLTALEAAARTVRDHLHPGTLVILESTTYPGTTEQLLSPILAESGLAIGTDVAVAYSPERIDPGNPKYSLRNTPKVIAGVTRTCSTHAMAFYCTFVDDLVIAQNPREAEMAKLLENTYRHVNIALVNELSIICHDLGINVWKVIELAATKPFGFQPFTPGPGVGGHCIPVDPTYLSASVRTELGYPMRLVELAQEINNHMPAYVVHRAQELLNTQRLPLNGARILLFGITYKPEVADMRESPAIPIARLLRNGNATVEYHDRHISEWSVDGHTIPRAALPNPATHYDLGVLLQQHDSGTAWLLHTCNIVLDTRGCLHAASVVHL